MENFETEAAVLVAMDGGIRVASRQELADALARLMADTGFRARTGSNALRAVESQRGAQARTAALVRKYIPVRQ